MAPSSDKISSLAEALEYFRQTLEANPQRNRHAAEEAVLAGRRRRFPVIGLIHPSRPDDDFEVGDEPPLLPEVRMPAGAEANFARKIIARLSPLKLLNLVRPGLAVGAGTGTLVTSFGIPINEAADSTPAFTRPLAEVLSEPPPDPRTSGLIPQMRERIAMLKGCTPEWFKVQMPDTQGPYNIVHAVIGQEALTAPYTDRARFHELMARVTDFWIAAVANLREWIGPRRLAPWNRLTRICECSVNMLSPQMYVEHVLPYDRRIAEAFAPLDIHTCSGAHVFHATLENLPGVAATEAGYGEGLAAGYTDVDDALDAIGDRPIVLRIGQMLPRGEEFEFIRRDLDRYERHPRLLFHYTGMHWLKRDRPLIRDIHRRLDEYWDRKYAA
jgi:hypothetical protein